MNRHSHAHRTHGLDPATAMTCPGQQQVLFIGIDQALLMGRRSCRLSAWRATPQGNPLGMSSSRARGVPLVLWCTRSDPTCWPNPLASRARLMGSFGGARR
jgi:hypothetical protein